MASTSCRGTKWHIFRCLGDTDCVGALASSPDMNIGHRLCKPLLRDAQSNLAWATLVEGCVVTSQSAEGGVVNWEQRLRDMVLAGAALTAAACSDAVQSTVDASGSGSGSASGSSGASGGSTGSAGSGSAGSAGSGSASGSGSTGGSSGVVPCCNANSDPCCPFVYCGAPMSPACACKSDGGTWNYSGGTCSFSQDAGHADAVEDNDAADATVGPTDAIDDKNAMDANDGASDAPSDAVSHFDVSPFCCNANPDPCCRFQYCGEPMTPACACRSDGGTWSYSSGACSFPSEAGSSDAADDGDAHD
jgi:hypothetical protein